MANISTEKIYLKTGTQFQKIVKYSKGIFSYALGLTFKWGVYSKKQFKDKKDYTFISGRPFGSFMWRNEMQAGIVEIEHTEDREKFFLELDLSFATMIAKVYKALGDLTSEKLTALTESGLKLLTN